MKIDWTAKLYKDVAKIVFSKPGDVVYVDCSPYAPPTSEQDAAVKECFDLLAAELDDDLKEVASRLPWRVDYINRLLEIQKLRLARLHLTGSAASVGSLARTS